MTVAADTSFVIALFVDEPRSEKARTTFRRLRQTREKVYIPAQVIVEVVYVLEKFYRLERQRVADYVRAILSTYIFIVDREPMFIEVMEMYRKHPRINFGDLIIAADIKQRKVKKILGFDKHFEKLGLGVMS